MSVYEGKLVKYHQFISYTFNHSYGFIFYITCLWVFRMKYFFSSSSSLLSFLLFSLFISLLIHIFVCDFITTFSLIRLIAVTDTDPLINGVNIISVQIFLTLLCCFFSLSLSILINAIYLHLLSSFNLASYNTEKYYIRFFFLFALVFWLLSFETLLLLWPRRLHTINSIYDNKHITTNNISIWFFFLTWNIEYVIIYVCFFSPCI